MTRKPYWSTTLAILQCPYFLSFSTFLPGKAHGLTTLPSSGPQASTSHPTIQVWNDVLSTQICDTLHDCACSIGLGHRVFTRSHDKAGYNNSHNIVEQVLNSILNELGDDSKYVEYWTRQEWRNIHAHADIDEYLAKRQIDAPFRFPMKGHVLYLHTGSEVRGPTCVFPDMRSGGDLLKTAIDKNDDNDFDLVVIPAVSGRLLRFQGDYLHAVPRPTDLWLLNFVQGAPDFQPESKWGRSVILFNTWGNQPPLEVPIDEAIDLDMPLDIEKCSCNEKDNWKCIFPSEHPYKSIPSVFDENSSVTAKVWLLGDYRRRGHQMQTVKLSANEDIRRALHEESIVSSVSMRLT
ncbi:hypothetical protein IV203_036079 [Nitzschia inconspicua]|uniref:Uncharacterized protein n=1 Tax=Nitzschia inconspicua TaxID=303405 RepID=A0A9K3LEK8_9STRA|nr:hypothetical protein IV203_036079 [Nitzschia inconspicua]